MTEITIIKPQYQWLFGGLGFHNSEATMYPIMSEDFLNQRVLKTFHEISPSFSRLYAGFADWTPSAMQAFAEYYRLSFEKADTTIYAVPGRMPLIETEEEMQEYVDMATEKLRTLIKDYGVQHIRYYCATNELSVGNTYAMLAEDMDKFKLCHTMFWRAFRKKALQIGLAASDGSGFQNYWQVDWAAEHMDEITDVYCTHNYEICGHSYDDPEFYSRVYNETDRVVQVALQKQKRYMLGEFGVHDATHFASPVMRSDVFAGYGDARKEAEAALMAATHAIAAINAGTLALAYWSFCDYPDPMLKDWSNSEYGRKKYEVCRFSGHGIDVRYNKNGLFRWSDDEDYSSRPFLYSIGLLAKYFRRDARLLKADSTSKNVLCCAMRNPDKSVSICLINLKASQEQLRLNLELPISQALRCYRFSVENVPYSPFNDLQNYSELIEPAADGMELTLPSHSMTLLTTDYVNRTPTKIENIALENETLTWDECRDAEHCYYRIYRGSEQIASTVATKISRQKGKITDYKVISVDRYGNSGAL